MFATGWFFGLATCPKAAIRVGLKCQILPLENFAGFTYGQLLLLIQIAPQF
jgi:hypothetical protein